MPEMLPPNLNQLPEAVAIAKRRRLPQLVWIVPLIAVLIGGWLVANAIAQRGPTVVISFLTAEGIEPGKTRIRYKDVDIGEVKSVMLAKDRNHVLVTAQLAKQAEKFLVSDTRFWVVRPRISGGKISGIGTLFSGAYIGVDVGKSSEVSSEFVGLEVAPILVSGLPGRYFVLHAGDIGSIGIGSTVFFRRIQVGEVVALDLDKDGGNVTVKVFIHAPYDRYVTSRTRFWNASGVDVSLDANGVRLQSQSLVSILLGGIAFETPSDDQKADEAPVEAVFVLHPNRALAMKAPDGEPLILMLNFGDSIRGLTPGAPVDFRGIAVGEVLSVGVEYEQKRDLFYFPVRIALYTERFGSRGSNKGKDTAGMIKQGLVKAMNERGLRAQLHTGNLLTGQLYIALDFFPDLKKSHIDWSKEPRELPTVRGNFEEFQVSLAKVLAKLEKMPLDEIGTDLRSALKTLDHTAKSIDKLAQRIDGETAPEINAGIKDLRATLSTVERLLAADSPLQQDVRDALREVGRAAQSFRTLSETLERQPEALIRGKKEEQP
jgi:paraquat-inducible protein B